MGQRSLTKDVHGLVGRAAEVFISDPWEFMSELGTGPLTGRVRFVDEVGGRIEGIVIELDRAITFQRRPIAVLDARPRYREGWNAYGFGQGAPMPATFEGMTAASDGTQGQPVPLLGDVRLK